MLGLEWGDEGKEKDLARRTKPVSSEEGGIDGKKHPIISWNMIKKGGSVEKTLLTEIVLRNPLRGGVFVLKKLREQGVKQTPEQTPPAQPFSG